MNITAYLGSRDIGSSDVGPFLLIHTVLVSESMDIKSNSQSMTMTMILGDV